MSLKIKTSILIIMRPDIVSETVVSSYKKKKKKRERGTHTDFKRIML